MGRSREVKGGGQWEADGRHGREVAAAIWGTGCKVLALMAMAVLAGCAPSPPYPIYRRPPPAEIYPYQEPIYPFQEQEEQDQGEHERQQEEQEQDRHYEHRDGEEREHRDQDPQYQESP
ncbi:MAG: hypothetical protein M0T84_11265 [Betaproteobacteria bacterium]|nr:hypothetical protein [Betaproteobacteria bacterium]